MRGISPALSGGGRVLFGIILLSLVLRLFSAAFQGNQLETLPGVYDQVSYHALASRVLDGHGFSFATNWWPATKAGEPTAHWSFVYTLFLAVIYFPFGPNPLIARIVQVLIVSVLHPWLSWRIGSRLYGERAGLAAALFAAVYGYFIYYSGALVTESFYILSILWAIELSTRMASEGRDSGIVNRRDWLLLGLAMGTAVLLRQLFLIVVPLILGWLVVARQGRPETYRARRWETARGVATACLIVALMILPWTLRNFYAFERFVLLNTNAGYAFFWGNHPIHGTNFIPILRPEDPSYGSLIPRELANLDEADLERELLSRGLGFVAQDPGRFLRLSLSRTKEYFKFWPSSDSGLASNTVRVMSFGLFLPLMLAGLIIQSYRAFSRPDKFGRKSLLGQGHVLLLLFAVSYTVIHLLTWTLVRYRLPVDAVLLLFAGAGASWLLGRVFPSKETLEVG